MSPILNSVALHQLSATKCVKATTHIRSRTYSLVCSIKEICKICAHVILDKTLKRKVEIHINTFDRDEVG